MKKLSLFTSCVLISNALFAIAIHAIGIQVGPFELQLRGGSRYNRSVMLDTPICYAIQNHKQIEVVIEREEVAGDKETTLQIKKIVFEPYLFGLTKGGSPILRGRIVSEDLIKEVTMRYEKEHGLDKDASPKTSSGFFSGLFKSFSSNKHVDVVDLHRVGAVGVIENSHFDAPKNSKEIFGDEPIDVICQIETSK